MTTASQALEVRRRRATTTRRVVADVTGDRRRLLRIVVDAGIWWAALYGAAMLRLDFNPARLDAFHLVLLVPVAIVLQICFGLLTGLYRGRWVNGSFDEVGAIAQSVTGVTVVLLGVDLLVPELSGVRRPAPVSAVIGGGILAFLSMGGARYLSRRVLEARRRARLGSRKPAIVFGAGEGGDRIIRAMLYEHGSPYVPVALLDDDPMKQGLIVRGVRVEGTRAELARVASAHGAEALIIAVPTGDGTLVRDLTQLGRDAGLAVRVLPSVNEILGGELHVTDIREPTEADLLGRHKVTTDLASVAEYITGRRVVVTGAGGSIGSELCRQLGRFAPARLVMIDRDEAGLHAVQLSMEGHGLLDSEDLVLLDIRDRERVRRLFTEVRPDVVFHAAALKHLPLLQAHPVEALKSNVWGTLSVLDAAAAAGVGVFVNISTDKAANACNALGYSKRITEALTSHFGRHHPGTWLSVRFGNVLGSRGSVLTTFRAQLEAGQPLTVTDPDVTRFFMTVEEAVQLVIQAGAIGRDGAAMVLDMGEPVRIYDVARQMAASRRPEPPIVFTGLRPGEKLHEELFCAHERPQRSAHELISYVEVPPLAPDPVRRIDPTLPRDELLRLLETLARRIDERTVDALDAETDVDVLIDLTLVDHLDGAAG